MRVQLRFFNAGSGLAQELVEQRIGARAVGDGTTLLVDELPKVGGAEVAPGHTVELYRTIPTGGRVRQEVRIEAEEHRRGPAEVVCGPRGEKLTPLASSVRVDAGVATFRITGDFGLVRVVDDTTFVVWRITLSHHDDGIVVVRWSEVTGSAQKPFAKAIAAARAKWSERRLKSGIYYANEPPHEPKWAKAKHRKPQPRPVAAHGAQPPAPAPTPPAEETAPRPPADEEEPPSVRDVN